MMHKNLLFTSPKGKTILFDDYVWEEAEDTGEDERSVWCCLCRSCHKKYGKILGSRCDGDGQGLCSVDGCMNDADYYVDFLTTDNLKIVEVEGND